MTARSPAAAASAAIALLLAVAPAAADPLPPVHQHAPAIGAPAPPDRSFLASAQLGFAAQPSPEMKQVYGRRNPWTGEARLVFLFGERFGVGAGVGFSLREGTGVAPAGEEAPTTWMWQVPIHVEGTIRLLLWREQPVVPYLRGGPSAVVWSETWPDPSGRRQALSGVKWGVFAAGGAQVRLPFPEINMRDRAVGDPVLDDIWLHLEGIVRAADDFGAGGLDLGSAGVAVGLTLLM